MPLPTPASREDRARELLKPYGVAMSTSDLAELLAYKTTAPVLDLIRDKEFAAINLGRGRYSIPTETLIPWLAARLTDVPEENR
jgi:hypothetical protein